ncbi:MAG TPA: ABC transporter ATP-binding protein [Candidatus Dormibacteraeota bacterium]|nr:ABC transporter ATP-binding protein [Candidatus Dormibacteraeota bacterium]
MGLELHHIAAGYGSQRIVFDVSAVFESGKVSAIIGPNGAGKSTLIKALFGQARLFRGDVSLDGRKLEQISPRALVQQGVAYVPQLANVFPTLSVRENLEIGTYVRSGDAWERVLGLFPDLRSVLRVPAGKLSGGQRNMVAIGRALMSDPRVLLLDEATAGLSPALAEGVWGHLTRLARDGLAVCVVEQNVRAALDYSDYVYLLTSGRVRLQGPTATVATDGELERLFLGSGEVEMAADTSTRGGTEGWK